MVGLGNPNGGTGQATGCDVVECDFSRRSTTSIDDPGASRICGGLVGVAHRGDGDVRVSVSIEVLEIGDARSDLLIGSTGAEDGHIAMGVLEIDGGRKRVASADQEGTSTHLLGVVGVLGGSEEDIGKAVSIEVPGTRDGSAQMRTFAGTDDLDSGRSKVGYVDDCRRIGRAVDDVRSSCFFLIGVATGGSGGTDDVVVVTICVDVTGARDRGSQHRTARRTLDDDDTSGVGVEQVQFGGRRTGTEDDVSFSTGVVGAVIGSRGSSDDVGNPVPVHISGTRGGGTEMVLGVGSHDLDLRGIDEDLIRGVADRREGCENGGCDHKDSTGIYTRDHNNYSNFSK